ncbi:hypothetical protein BT93_J1005 [Corymbia citriodora subsp. variegata]|nr:hypothetical protein BT93_J1005 [Corymbia citriodora subsp. variegata]
MTSGGGRPSHRSQTQATTVVVQLLASLDPGNDCDGDDEADARAPPGVRTDDAAAGSWPETRCPRGQGRNRGRRRRPAARGRLEQLSGRLGAADDGPGGSRRRPEAGTAATVADSVAPTPRERNKPGEEDGSWLGQGQTVELRLSVPTDATGRQGGKGAIGGRRRRGPTQKLGKRRREERLASGVARPRLTAVQRRADSLTELLRQLVGKERRGGPAGLATGGRRIAGEQGWWWSCGGDGGGGTAAQQQRRQWPEEEEAAEEKEGSSGRCSSRRERERGREFEKSKIRERRGERTAERAGG